MVQGTQLTGAQLKLLDRYEGVAVESLALSQYQSWALRFFHDSTWVANPMLSMTVTIDISPARTAYASSEPQQSFTAYLTWKLIQALKRNRCFNYRRLSSQWYEFFNLPLFFPVAIENAERFGEVVLEDVRKMSWSDFISAYREGVDRILNHSCSYRSTDSFIYSIADFIGNLPDLQFTALTLQRPAESIGRPLFYFGKRYYQHDRYWVPLSISFDHANTDPVLVNQLLKDYEQGLAQPATMTG